jgi:hypothetical protein
MIGDDDGCSWASFEIQISSRLGAKSRLSPAYNSSNFFDDDFSASGRSSGL